jgi:hypothetical protein
VNADDRADGLTSGRTFVRPEVAPVEERIDRDDAIPEEYGGLRLTVQEEVELVLERGWARPVRTNSPHQRKDGR